jgi:hypothetical protein
VSLLGQSNVVRIDGAASGNWAGTSVAGAGDVNGDGLADVVVGAQTARNNGRPDSGSAYVVFGKASPETIDLDTTAPTLTLTVRSPQRVLRQKGVLVTISSDEACTLSASGTIAIGGQRTRLALRTASGTLSEFGRRTLKLALSPAGTRRLTRPLDQRKRASAKVTVRARDRAGNASTAKPTAAVRR